jgi:hypothetical protein
MSEPTPEELLAGLSRRRPPVESAEEATTLLAEMRWHRELYISDPVLRTYLERLDEAVADYVRRLERRLALIEAEARNQPPKEDD